MNYRMENLLILLLISYLSVCQGFTDFEIQKLKALLDGIQPETANRNLDQEVRAIENNTTNSSNEEKLNPIINDLQVKNNTGFKEDSHDFIELNKNYLVLGSKVTVPNITNAISNQKVEDPVVSNDNLDDLLLAGRSTDLHKLDPDRIFKNLLQSINGDDQNFDKNNAKPRGYPVNLSDNTVLNDLLNKVELHNNSQNNDLNSNQIPQIELSESDSHDEGILQISNLSTDISGNIGPIFSILLDPSTTYDSIKINGSSGVITIPKSKRNKIKGNALTQSRKRLRYWPRRSHLGKLHRHNRNMKTEETIPSIDVNHLIKNLNLNTHTTDEVNIEKVNENPVKTETKTENIDSLNRLAHELHQESPSNIETIKISEDNLNKTQNITQPDIQNNNEIVKLDKLQHQVQEQPQKSSTGHSVNKGSLENRMHEELLSNVIKGKRKLPDHEHDAFVRSLLTNYEKFMRDLESNKTEIDVQVGGKGNYEDETDPQISLGKSNPSVIDPRIEDVYNRELPKYELQDLNDLLADNFLKDYTVKGSAKKPVDIHKIENNNRKVAADDFMMDLLRDIDQTTNPSVKQYDVDDSFSRSSKNVVQEDKDIVNKPLEQDVKDSDAFKHLKEAYGSLASYDPELQLKLAELASGHSRKHLSRRRRRPIRY